MRTKQKNDPNLNWAMYNAEKASPSKKQNTKAKLPQCDHNEMVRDPVGKYGYWMCAKCFRPYGKPEVEPQAEPSHLPWHCDSQRIWNDAGETIANLTTCGSARRKANAKLIVRSVNQAQALAEALRCALADLEGIMPEFEPDGERTHPGWTTIKDAREALANWEGAK